MIDMKPTELKDALKVLQPYLRLAAVFSIPITLLALLPIAYMREVYGPVIDARSERTLAWVTLLLLMALTLSGVLEWIRSRVMTAASVKLSEQMSRRIFEAAFRAHMQRLPEARVALTDFQLVRNFLTTPVLVSILDAPLGIVFLLLVFVIHPLMGLISLAGALMVLTLAWVTEKTVRPIVKRAQQLGNQAQIFATDSSRNAEVVEAMGMRESIRARWQVWQDEFLGQQALASKSQAWGSAASKFVMVSQGSLLLGIGVFLTLTGLLPPAAAGAIVIAKILGARAMAPVMTLIGSWKQLEAARDAFERLESLLGKVPVQDVRMSLPAPRGTLRIERATLRPPGSKQTVLSDVNFVLKAGHTLAVVGPSGSGKSSLARMIIGLWPPLAGTVRLDGVNITSWDKSQLGPHLGYLPQDVELFDGTLADNIARFGEIDVEKLADAIRLSGLSALVEHLPQGVETDIGNGGATLSGGQRQRVGLARALYGSPQLLVLDEPNSSLDEAGDLALLGAVQEMKRRGSTVVVITHRTGLLSVADQMLVLAKGSPRLYGPRDQVLAKLKNDAGGQPSSVKTSAAGGVAGADERQDPASEPAHSNLGPYASSNK